jgi:ubiquinone/menaquinone biosynthesis C-methylase UbiE
MENFEDDHPIESEFDEERFQNYVEDLRLTSEDFQKKILDVGAGSAQFAKWAKDHGVSSEIYSIEPEEGRLMEREKGVIGVAEKLPFADESFDLLVSTAAIPNVYIGEDEHILKAKVTGAFSEIVRVLKSGGEARLARVLIGSLEKTQCQLARNIRASLNDMQENNGISVEWVRTPSDDTFDYKKDGAKDLRAEAYLLIIHK